MTHTLAANDAFVKPAGESLKCGELEIEIPKGHTGPVMLSGSGRTVWWTGRVAIGLRYEAPRHTATSGQAARWVQDLLLEHA